MSKNGLELLPGGNQVMRPKCTVHLDNIVETFDDFVTLGFVKEKGEVKVVHNCDILTLKVGMEVLARAMCDMYDNMSQEEKDLVDPILNGKAVLN